MLFRDENTHLFEGFYKGKVEDIDDPLNRGRVKVRVLGIHSQSKLNFELDPEDGIPDDELPWAEQAAPIFGGFGPAKAGVAQVPEEGSWVWLFFEAGDHQKPVYFASCIGQDDRPLEEINLNRLGQSLNDETTVITTKAGHTIEIVDAEGAEQININHANGGAIHLGSLNDNPLVVITGTDEGTVHIEAKECNIMSSGNGEGGYPLLAGSKDTQYIINGEPLRSGHTRIK